MHWNQQRDILSVKGFPLKIDLIPEMVRSLCSKAETILEKLLLGTPNGAFDRAIDTALDSNDPGKWPVDPLRNTAEGFSFVHSSDNAFFPFLAMVLEHIHNDPSVFDIYHFVDNQGCLLHKPGRLHLYPQFLVLIYEQVHSERIYIYTTNSLTFSWYLPISLRQVLLEDRSWVLCAPPTLSTVPAIFTL
jgi:hypothetical protein